MVKELSEIEKVIKFPCRVTSRSRLGRQKGTPPLLDSFVVPRREEYQHGKGLVQLVSIRASRGLDRGTFTKAELVQT